MWNVVQSESLNGAKIYDNTKVVSLDFDENNEPVFAAYSCRPSSDAGDTVNGTINFKYLVGGTGRAGLMSTKYSKIRSFTESLKNIAVWGY